MGMYNEVFKRCPECGKRGYLQIHQIVLGFGGFNMDDPETLKELSPSQLEELHEAIEGETFVCAGQGMNDEIGCSHCWVPYPKKEEAFGSADKVMAKAYEMPMDVVLSMLSTAARALEDISEKVTDDVDQAPAVARAALKDLLI